MDCRETRKNIYRFIEDQLDYKELQAFLHHVENCEECKEELSIQYLVTEGMQHLEKGSAFDLKKHLDEKMAASARKVHTRQFLFWLMYGLEAAAILTIIIMVVLVILK